MFHHNGQAYTKVFQPQDVVTQLSADHHNGLDKDVSSQDVITSRDGGSQAQDVVDMSTLPLPSNSILCVDTHTADQCPNINALNDSSSQQWESTDTWQSFAVCKVMADMPLSIEMKQSLRQGSFEVILNMFRRILEHTRMIPEIDVFATPRNTKCRKYWTQHDNAFQYDWGQDLLWICPPFSQLDVVIEKIRADEA